MARQWRRTNVMIHPENLVWETIDPDELWAMDKLILSRKLGYVCGPTGHIENIQTFMDALVHL